MVAREVAEREVGGAGQGLAPARLETVAQVHAFLRQETKIELSPHTHASGPRQSHTTHAAATERHSFC